MMSENTKRDTDSEYQQSIKHADPFNSELDPMIVFGFSIQSIKIRVIQSEPKILRLVIM